jgi:hypothetical protein
MGTQTAATVTVPAMLTIDLNTGRLADQQTEAVFAALPYRYEVQGNIGPTAFRETDLVDRSLTVAGDTMVLTGRLPAAQLALRQEVRTVAGGLDEIISLTNHSSLPVQLSDIGIGFATRLADHAGWHLAAIPFTVQLDGSRHHYTVADLGAGGFKNAVCFDNSKVEPPVVEANRLRSEAWAWRCGDVNLVVMKYNAAEMELSVAAVLDEAGAKCLRFGGVGTCLYGEPIRLHRVAPGQTVTFGVTMYRVVRGDLTAAHTLYRAELDRRGHGFPSDYNPPVNWNELYDIGWHHSDPAALQQHYTREALERQAALAKDVGCELLYLDPGWEVAEGLTRWDEARLGKQSEFAATLRDRYGLALGIRCILRCNGDAAHHEWDERFVVRHAFGTRVIWHNYKPSAGHKEYCLCAPEFRRQKLERIDAVIKGGACFLMVDEMDWRGPCHDPNHGHPVPSTHNDHVRAVYALCRELRERNPNLLVECHDPLWPWHTCIYVPTYFQQAFKGGAYQENWGFEYMWNCLDDLKSGKALALYYYALGCNIPLYLHITMAADNDACVFFWWAASTVRHLGIGGKQGHPTINPANLPPHDPEKRFAAYKQQMARYRRLKPWFVHGTFHGISETAHLHTQPGMPGGVLNLFNLTDAPKDMEVRIPLTLLSTDKPLTVDQGQAEWSKDAVTIRLTLPAMSPAVLTLGGAA